MTVAQLRDAPSENETSTTGATTKRPSECDPEQVDGNSLSSVDTRLATPTMNKYRKIRGVHHQPNVKPDPVFSRTICFIPRQTTKREGEWYFSEASSVPASAAYIVISALHR